MAANFTDNGGAVIQFVRVQLIYWGSAWNSNPPPTPTSAQVTNAANRILTGGYMTGIAQYRGIGQGYLLGSTTVTASSPNQNFTDADVASLIKGLISAKTIPDLDRDNQTLYCVFVPKGINHVGGGSIGEHTYYTDASNRRVHFAWVMNNGTLDYITTILSHELVESCTDPEGTAVTGTAGTCGGGGGWCEIGDVCQGTDGQVNGVKVQSYWSQSDKACKVFDYPATNFPFTGVQFTGTVPANSSGRWFTFNWPAWWQTHWTVMPTSISAAGAQISVSAAAQRTAGAYVTHWLTVSNQTNVPVTFEGRYEVLGKWTS